MATRNGMAVDTVSDTTSDSTAGVKCYDATNPSFISLGPMGKLVENFMSSPLHTPPRLHPRLKAQALLMTHYRPLRALDAYAKLLLEAPVFSSALTQYRKAQRNFMNAWNPEDDDELQDNLTMAQLPLGYQIRALKAAPLNAKSIVLTSMPVIDVFHAAVFLRTDELAFKHFNIFHHDVFGQCYMNQRRYSLDELKLIESNPEWLSGHCKSLAPAATLLADNAKFDGWTVLEEKVAMAFCNITRDELPEVAYVTSHNVATYYLADLEIIRLEKLKTQQQ